MDDLVKRIEVALQPPYLGWLVVLIDCKAEIKHLRAENAALREVLRMVRDAVEDSDDHAAYALIDTAIEAGKTGREPKPKPVEEPHVHVIVGPETVYSFRLYMQDTAEMADLEVVLSGLDTPLVRWPIICVPEMHHSFDPPIRIHEGKQLEFRLTTKSGFSLQIQVASNGRDSYWARDEQTNGE